MSIINAFTVDVEDYYHVSAFADQISNTNWDQYESRVERNTHRILDLLDRQNIRGTFFILGWVAEQYPELVREIDLRGHEIGTHSYWHRLVYDQTPDEFREDLVRSIEVLNSITGKPITLYRAPSFSITRRSQWALQILAEEGIQLDSSIFPIVHDRYGIPDAEPLPHRVQIPDSDLDIGEFPPSVYRKWRVNWPISGGGYFRLYPYRWSLRLLQSVNEEQQAPFMFYIHPWEVDPEQPRIKAKLKSRFRHYQNLKTTEHKLEKLLSDFRFGTLTESWNSFFQGKQDLSQESAAVLA